jgi:hypothetical protein
MTDRYSVEGYEKLKKKKATARAAESSKGDPSIISAADELLKASEERTASRLTTIQTLPSSIHRQSSASQKSPNFKQSSTSAAGNKDWLSLPGDLRSDRERSPRLYERSFCQDWISVRIRLDWVGRRCSHVHCCVEAVIGRAVTLHHEQGNHTTVQPR